jgi:hypothetical protein
VRIGAVNISVGHEKPQEGEAPERPNRELERQVEPKIEKKIEPKNPK